MPWHDHSAIGSDVELCVAGALLPACDGDVQKWLDIQDATRISGSDRPFSDRWWTALRDPAIDTLVLTAFGDSPTVDEVVSRFDEARAALRGVGAQRLPSIQANASAPLAEDAAIVAARDDVLAWVALMKAIGVVTPPLQTSA